AAVPADCPWPSAHSRVFPRQVKCKRSCYSNQYVRLIGIRHASDPPLLSRCTAPATFSLPDSLHGAPACTRTEALVGGTPLRHKALVAAWPVTIVVEKSLE